MIAGRRIVAGTVAVLSLGGLSLPAVSAEVSGPAGAAGSPITLALVTSQTGLAAPQFQDSVQGFDARIALQNARGGVNGHPLVPLVINDNTNPAQTVTAVQQAISKGVLGIVSVTPLFYAADRYPQQAGVPVTGAAVDGPEWGEKPFTNMFASDTGSVNPTYPATTGLGTFLRAHGGSVIGSYGYGISPLSAHSAVTAGVSFQHAGGKVGVVDTSVPFGGVDFTNEALVAKQKGVNAVYAGLQNNSNVAMIAAFQQAGVKLKAVVFPTGFEPDVVNTPAWSTMQGAYFLAEFRPFSLPNAGTQQMAAALQKYAHRPPSKFPDFGVYEAWLGADLMIRGIQQAGGNPTQAGVVRALRKIKSYDGNGLLPVPIDYSTVFGKGVRPMCDWFVQAQRNGFVPVSPKPFCGVDIPGTGTAPPS